MKLFKMITNFVLAAAITLALIPAAFAASSNTNVTLKAGPFTISPITVGNFGQIILNGQDQTAQASISNFTVTDARGNSKGWSVQISATRFASGKNLLHDGALTISGTTGDAVGHSDSFEKSYIFNPTKITTVPSKYIVVPNSKGKGTFNFSGGILTLDIWPNEVLEGTYTSTVTIDVVANIN